MSQTTEWKLELFRDTFRFQDQHIVNLFSRVRVDLEGIQQSMKVLSEHVIGPEFCVLSNVEALTREFSTLEREYSKERDCIFSALLDLDADPRRPFRDEGLSVLDHCSQSLGRIALCLREISQQISKVIVIVNGFTAKHNAIYLN